MNAREMRQRREGLVTEANGILQAAQTANRDLLAEERTKYDDLITTIKTLNGDIQRVENMAALQDEQTRNANGSSARKPDPQDPTIGLSEREIKRYSLVRAINAAASQNWRGAEFEREASEAVATKLGRSPQGFWAPPDWMHYAPNEKRAAGDLFKGTSGSPGAGYGLVATDLLSQSFIDILRARLVFSAMGITVLGGLVGDVAIPRQNGGATHYWVSENGTPTGSNATVDQVPLTPKTIGAWTKLSRKLLKQSSIDVEAFVRNDLAATLARGLEKAGIHGAGASNEPGGLAILSGIGAVVGGTNGAAPTWANVVGLETAVAASNADVGNLSYLTNAKARGKLKTTPRVSGTNDNMIWSDNNSPLNGYGAYVTNQVRSDLTKGSGTALSAIFFGNWADMIMGMWGALDIVVDPYTDSKAGGVNVVALQDADIAFRHPESFSAMLDAITV